MNPKFQKGIPRDYLHHQFPNNESTPLNTCANCNRITAKLFAHEFKEGWGMRSVMAGVVGTKETKYCERRLCEACFSKLALVGSSCAEKGCRAIITNDLKKQSLPYDDFLNALVFICPLDHPCNQRLTYADFLRHTHQAKKAEKKKDQNQHTNTNVSGSQHENVKQSEGKAKSDKNDSSVQLGGPNFGVSTKEKNFSQNPSGTTDSSSLYPGKYYPEGQFTYTNGDYNDYSDTMKQYLFAGTNNKDLTSAPNQRDAMQESGTRSNAESSLENYCDSPQIERPVLNNAERHSELKSTKRNNQDEELKKCKRYLQFVHTFIEKQETVGSYHENKKNEQEIRQLKDEIQAHKLNTSEKDRVILTYQNENETLRKKNGELKADYEELHLEFQRTTQNLEVFKNTHDQMKEINQILRKKDETLKRYQSQYDELRVENTQKTEESNRLASSLRKLKAEHETVKEDRDSLEKYFTRYRDERNEERIKNTNLTGKLGDLMEEKAQLMNEHEETKDNLCSEIQALKRELNILKDENDKMKILKNATRTGTEKKGSKTQQSPIVATSASHRLRNQTSKKK